MVARRARLSVEVRTMPRYAPGMKKSSSPAR
jgi:hypothetical protein